MSEANATDKERLRSWAGGFGIRLPDLQLERLLLFLDELVDWNRKFNLTGIESRSRMLEELLLDSLIASPLLPDDGPLLDVGSGAGFPGIPLKICRPEMTVHLVEASAKKISFLKQVIRLLKLRRITAVRARIEEAPAPLLSGRYPVVTSRALANPAKTLQWCAPYIAPGGMMITFAGRDRSALLRETGAAIHSAGLALEQVFPYRLPVRGNLRHVLVLRRPC